MKPRRKKKAARERERIEKECAEKVGHISYSPPAILEPRRLSGSEIQEIKNACVRELNQDEGTRRVAATIDEFAAFCDLLRKPENHIKVRTGQYVEKEVTIRTEADMVNEMARELVGLPIFMAYARVRQERGGEQALFKGKIRTLRLPFVEVTAAQEAFARNRAKVEENSRRYLKPRDQIRLEIEERRERWRATVVEKQPAARVDENSALPGAGSPSVTKPDEPPPGTRYKSGR